MYSFLIDPSSEHKKAMGENNAPKIRKSEYKEILWNNKCLSIQWKESQAEIITFS